MRSAVLNRCRDAARQRARSHGHQAAAEAEAGAGVSAEAVVLVSVENQRVLTAIRQLPAAAAW